MGSNPIIHLFYIKKNILYNNMKKNLYISFFILSLALFIDTNFIHFVSDYFNTFVKTQINAYLIIYNNIYSTFFDVIIEYCNYITALIKSLFNRILELYDNYPRIKTKLELISISHFYMWFSTLVLFWTYWISTVDPIYYINLESTPLLLNNENNIIFLYYNIFTTWLFLLVGKYGHLVAIESFMYTQLGLFNEYFYTFTTMQPLFDELTKSSLFNFENHTLIDLYTNVFSNDFYFYSRHFFYLRYILLWDLLYFSIIFIIFFKFWKPKFLIKFNLPFLKFTSFKKVNIYKKVFNLKNIFNITNIFNFLRYLRAILLVMVFALIVFYILNNNDINLFIWDYTFKLYLIKDFNFMNELLPYKKQDLFNENIQNSFIYDLPSVMESWLFFNNFHLNGFFGADGITLLFIFLTIIVFGMVHFNIGTKKFNIFQFKFILCLTLLLEIQLILTFLSQNLLIFYILFESTLIPMFFIVGFFGTRSRKVVAAFYLFLYTIIGSLFLLIGVLIVYTYTNTFSIPEIYKYNFTFETQVLLWLLFFFGFAVKLPSIPFHLWLPEAHVEAPAVGSIVLAAILLKLGGYGLLRISLKMFPEACIFFQPLVFVIALISIIYASLTAIRQTDIKRIIAYSSIAHMNFALIGMFCFNKVALLGSFYLMFGHGLVSGGLFLLIGILYERYGTRSIFYYGGLMKVMPHFCTLFLILSLANMGFPGLVNFVGEFLIMLGIAEENLLLFFLTSLGFILSAVYSIWLFNRLAFGNIKTNYLKKFKDITTLEVALTLVKPLIVFVFIFGIFTKIITLLLDHTLTYYLIDYHYNLNYLAISTFK